MKKIGLVLFAAMWSGQLFAKYCGEVSEGLTICVEKVEDGVGHVEFSAIDFRSKCKAEIDRNIWKLDCPVRTQVKIGNELAFTEAIRPEFTLGTYRNPETSQRQARIRFVEGKSPRPFSGSALLTEE